ncbi:plexin-A2-like [Amphiura filiformis]|uniref:plexin-A2-like n=1 Tax=Amphiura filiformis TaxID=82378 RepID=UPI003B20EE67
MTCTHIVKADEGKEYERFSLGSPSSPAGQVLRDAHLDGEQEHVTLLTEQKVIKLKVSNCKAYKTCGECVSAGGIHYGDPYCGWCTLGKRCTGFDECKMAGVSTRWLPYNSAQCVGISSVDPYPHQPFTTPPSEIVLTVEQLPDLPTDKQYMYECVFDDERYSATKNGNQLTCVTPEVAKRPLIPSDSDHVAMTLSVYSTDTDVTFVSTSYVFYECSSHKMCVSCTISSWACDWCIYSNKCTHDNSICTGDDSNTIISGVNNPESNPKQGFEYCPQLAPQTKDVLVSVGVERSMQVAIQNLPSDEVTSYQCTLHVDGDEMKSNALRTEDVVICDARIYSYDEMTHMLDVRLSVVWNGDRILDDIYGYEVTLYKCEAERPDCSRCLSSLTTIPEVECGWCQTDDICSVEDSLQCTGGWIPSNTDTNCPNPVLTKVAPSSGPFEGNTVVTVYGTDLGQQFSDILLVTVGGKACSTESLYDFYIVGNSVSCRTVAGDMDAEVEIAVQIMGSDGNPQDSTGNVLFTYRDPVITAFEPVEGPADGGTFVYIQGMYLDAGYNISAMIGSNCVVERDSVTETSATCRTGSGTVGSSHNVTMFFDEAERQSEGRFTFQPNPEIVAIQPRSSIQSGGRKVTITGRNLRLAQNPMMIVYSGEANFTDICKVMNDTMMTCKTPKVDMKYQEISNPYNIKKRAANDPIKLIFGFLIADVHSLQSWSSKNNMTLDYYEDPVYEPFKANPEKYNGSILILNGRNLDIASSEEDVKVYVGPQEAVVYSLDEQTLTCSIPETNPGPGDFKGNQTKQGLPYVYVVHGNLEFEIGRLKYPEEEVPIVIIITSVLIAIAVLVAITVVVLYKIKYNKIIKREQELLDRLRTLQQDILSIQMLGENKTSTSQPVVLPNNVTIDADDVKIAYSQLTLGRPLGNGAFGQVFEASLQLEDSSSRRVAVKTIKDASGPSVTIKFLEEGLIMKDFNHNNVLGLIGLTFDPQGNPLVILPLMKNGDLKSFLKKAPTEVKNNSVQLTSFALDAATGMEYLAGRNFVHRDLAARNCMVDENLVTKIADFGLSRDMTESDYYVSKDVKAKLPVKWMAPESLDRRVYNEKTDVWSFGVLLWEIFSHGARPYANIANREMYYYIEQGNRLQRPRACSQDMYDMMLTCWGTDPKKRPTFSDLVHNITDHKAVQERNTTTIIDEESHKEGQGEADDVVVTSSYLEIKDPNDYYLEPMSSGTNPAEISLEPLPSGAAADNAIAIEMDTRATGNVVVEGTTVPHGSYDNLITQETTTEDYVNESVIKVRKNASPT